MGLNPFSKKIPKKDLVSFTTGLATLQRSGIPLLEALEGLMISCPSEKFKESIDEIIHSVERGETLAESLGEHDWIFDGFYQSMVAVGEKTGKLDQVLERLAEKIEREDDLAAQLRGAAAYPVFSLVVAAAVISFILVKIVPTFVTTFEDSGTALPAPTVAVITASNFLQEQFLLIIGAMFGIPFIYKWLLKNQNIRLVVDSVKLNLPMMGGLSKLVILNRFSKSLQILTDSGVPILDSLELLKNAISNEHFKTLIDEMSDDLSRGGRIADFILEHDEIFPPMYYQLISAGEKSGNLGLSLQELARYFDVQLQRKLKVLVSLVEPAMILFMAVSVGGIIISLFLPMFDLVKGLAG